MCTNMEEEGNAHTCQIHIRRNQNNKQVDRKGGQTYEQGHAYTKSTMPKICVDFAGKKK